MRARLGVADGLADDEVEAEFRTALLEASVWNSEPTRARVAGEYAAWLAARGRGEEAEPMLAEARKVFDRLGASAWARELETRLAGISA
jgi:hypothetical protein